MSHLSMTKELDGNPVVFVRFDGPERLVVDVAGAEKTVTRKQWDSLPERLPGKEDAASVSYDTDGPKLRA